MGLNGAYQSFTGFATGNQFQILGRNLRVGHATFDVNGAFPGDIMEIVWYNRALTANEQSRVNSYLAIKNGVTASEDYIDAASTVVWSIAGNTGYNNNIFGLARDNASALHQKQAASTANGQQLVIGNGTSLFDSNAANTNDLTEKQFLLVGDNGLKQSLTVPFSYTGGSNGDTNYRFESVWKVQNTNNVGTVTVAWPKGVKNLYLVQSNDAAFGSGNTYTPMTTEVTVGGVVYNVAHVTLTNGQYFTFAGFGNSPGGVAGGLSYWYRADKNNTNTGAGTDVTAWTDMWNGTTVAQLGTNALPKYVSGASNYFNFNPGINFTANTQTLGNNTVRTLTSLNYDVFTLTKEGMSNSGGNPRVFSIARDNSGSVGIPYWDAFGIWPANNTNIERRVYGTPSSPGGTSFPAINPAFSTTIPSIMYHKSTDTSTAKGLNGAALGTAGTFSAQGEQFGGHLFGDTRFSGNGSDNAGFTGNIGETIVYGAGTLSATERRKVDSYLAIKYGITLGRVNTDHYLDTDGNQVWNGAADAVYNNNIFGVAKDDIEAFEQKVSKSVNAGTILTVATINDFVNPNQDASRTGFANDKTYFLLGDNNVTATTLNSITVGSMAGPRIQRAWLSQRKDTPGALYFEADLSAYGVTFASGSDVKMIIADDAAFTTNVVTVSGTFTGGRWVHTHSFDAENANRYITYAVLAPVQNHCVAGCNPNTYVNSTDPNTIEYDNMVSLFHSTIIKESNGVFKTWGEFSAPDGTGHLLVPTAVTPANGFNYTGTPLRATGGSYIYASAYHQLALLTTDGLYVWGVTDILISSSIKNTTAFGKITVNGKADGLPPGVMPQQVKMMFGSYGTLAITTCTGEAWVLSSVGNKNGDGTPDNPANNMIWHRVKTAAAGNPDLTDVVAMRGTKHALFALTSSGKLYTWGTNTYINDGSAATNRTYATEVTVPAGVTPKMIGMTGSYYTYSTQSYYLLATNGKLYAMGDNQEKQLADGTTTNRTTWVQPQKVTNQHGQGTGPLENIAWISPNEHDSAIVPAINVLTNNNKLWAWGANDGNMIGGPTNGAVYDPIYMPGSSTNANGMAVTDEIIAVETGGHTTLNVKKGEEKFGYVGHRVNGSMDNGSNANVYENVYTYETADVMICGAESPPAVQDLTICNGTTANLNDANLAAIPSEVEWHATDDANSPVMTNITAVAPGTYYAFYTVASGKPRTVSSAATVTGVVCCTTGDCNPNTFVNSTDPNTIEYDNMVSTYHSTIIKEGNGVFKTWGELTAPNGTSHLYSPTAITPANGFNYTGTPLKATGGSIGQSSYAQYALLTTDGLYVWGTANTLISSGIKNTTAFGKITVNGKADGLPPGVIPGQVKMMFGTYQTLAIVTCSGEAWVLSMIGNKNGDGTPQDAANNAIWHRVKTSAAGNPDLTDVVAMRGTHGALFALTSAGRLYTWGGGTYINNGTAVTSRTYATEVTVPAGVTPKMIGMTSVGFPTPDYPAYYLLATDGKLYSMGFNAYRQLGDGTITTRTNWVQPQKVTNQHGQGTGPLENIAWISPNEHDNLIPAINVLTNDNKQWAWGQNDFYMIGAPNQLDIYDPVYMPGSSTNANGMAVTDEIIAVETGGHTSLNVKKGEEKFGYVGHYYNGSMGNGGSGASFVPVYSYNTADVMICGADTDSKEGYIYITKKALDENSSVDFNFTVNGGPVTAFTLNDKETYVNIKDLGSSANGRLWAAASDGTLYYRNAGSSDWVQTGVTTAARVDGASGNDCYFTNASGQVFRYDGTAAPALIGSPANFGSSNAVDVASAWNTTPYIITANQSVWMYSGSGTAWTQVGTTTNNTTAIDADPSTGDAVVTDGTLVYRLTSAGVKTSLGAPGYIDDIAVTSAGEVFISSAGSSVRKWNTGTTWHAGEQTSRLLASRMTGGHKEQVWSTNPVYPLLGKIYTRTVSGAAAQWLDDERVRTTSKGNSIMIKVPVGTYTVKETATAGWELQSMDVYDPTSDSAADYADQSVTLNVAEGETVHAVFTNGGATPFAMGIDCSTVFFEDFGSGAAGSFGGPLTGQTSYHYADGSNGAAQDGYYKVVGSTTDFAFWSTPETFDHTSNDGTGRMMAINASYDQGIFFRRKFTNLVPGKSYKFSAWLMSLSNDAIKPNATFQVVDPANGTVLNEVSSGDITTSHVWNEYSMTFVAGSTELNLILKNNAPGGDGNDIALDDIRFEMNLPENLTVTTDCSAGTVTVTSPLGAAYEYSIDNVTWQASPSFTGVPSSATNFYVRYADAHACVSTGTLPSCYCYKPGITTGTALDTKVGITALSRAGADNPDNWPMVRKGGWIALEAKTKGFVPNRVAFDGSGNPVGIAPANFVEGMMVYDTTNKCMKMYTLKEGDASMAWHCITTQACPD